MLNQKSQISYKKNSVLIKKQVLGEEEKRWGKECLLFPALETLFLQSALGIKSKKKRFPSSRTETVETTAVILRSYNQFSGAFRFLRI